MQTPQTTHASRPGSRRDQISGLSHTDPTLPANISRYPINDYGEDVRDKDNELLAKRSQELRSTEQAHTFIPGKIETKGKPLIKKTLVSWWPEIVWCIFTTGLLISLVVLLKIYNNKPAPQWPNGISINTVIAAIATIYRAAMVLPISEGLSQLK